MAPTHSRVPSLPCIPDVDLDFDEKSQLLPEFDEILSITGCDDTATLDEEHSQISRSRSSRTIEPRRIPIRFPSNSSGSSSSHTYSAIVPPPPRCVDLTYQPQLLQLPPSQKTVLESWTITYHLPTTRTTARCTVLGLTWWRRTEREEGSILSVVPNPHFSQSELASIVAVHEASVIPSSTSSSSPSSSSSVATGIVGGLRAPAAISQSMSSLVYAADLESRLRKLDWKVQDEIYELLSDRVQSSSNAHRRREWRVVALSCVPGGEMTDAPTGFGPSPALSAGGKLRKGGAGRLWRRVGRKEEGEGEMMTRVRRGRCGKMGRRAPEMPVTEYRLVLRGTETKANDQGWGYYNRYSRPWRDADEKEVGERRRWSSMTGRSDKYVDF